MASESILILDSVVVPHFKTALFEPGHQLVRIVVTGQMDITPNGCSKFDVRVPVVLVDTNINTKTTHLIDERSSITARMMGTHCGRIGVMVMQTTSKKNVRVKRDDRQAIDGASKHVI
ncbi:hypothetical protein TBK1r_43240 [Stieleria magnilauensis]|uniref:Uncharacterized protein n=1 Tax=Stieleria magnilauensis TaxID=2527963 RepID=A0ABX5XWM3_9BACT|nr:hypothetical protein TBK1r_43240 [Planctomycetes bacterium TBK1r]